VYIPIYSQILEINYKHIVENLKLKDHPLSAASYMSPHSLTYLHIPNYVVPNTIFDNFNTAHSLGVANVREPKCPDRYACTLRTSTVLTNNTSNNTNQERQIRREMPGKKTENIITEENIQEYENHKREQKPKYNQKMQSHMQNKLTRKKYSQ
jgi:hypothetical protein